MNPPSIHEKSVAHFTQKSQRFPSKSGFRFAKLLCSSEQAVLLGCCALIERSAVMSAVEHAHHIPGCAALQLEHFDALAALSVASASSAAASVAASVSALAACARRCAGCCSRGMTLFGARQRCRTLFSSPCALTASARPRSPNALALTVPLRARFAQVHGLPAWQPAPDGQDVWPRF